MVRFEEVLELDVVYRSSPAAVRSLPARTKSDELVGDARYQLRDLRVVFLNKTLIPT
jgi:hypothetical protein